MNTRGIAHKKSLRHCKHAPGTQYHDSNYPAYEAEAMFPDLYIGDPPSLPNGTLASAISNMTSFPWTQTARCTKDEAIICMAEQDSGMWATTAGGAEGLVCGCFGLL